MTYEEALARLGALGRFGVRPGLAATEAALAALGHPERAFPSLHIAGSNGKGSTAAFAESILRAKGARTGLYTSPHLSRYTERIRVAGVEIARDRLAALAERVLSLDAGLTFFEAATVIAFLAFAEAGVDVAVIECGLGGRLDATNVITPLASVVTGIALEHTEVLGTTLGAIAFEKAGIWKPGVPAIAGALDDEARVVIERRAVEVGAPLALVGREIRASLDGDRLDYDGPGGPLVGAALGLAGPHQANNAALALAATSHAPARFRPDGRARREGLAGARWPGRLERLAPDLVVDAAHNPDGAATLVRALPSLGRDFARAVFVIGVLADKDAFGIVAPLVAHAAAVVCCRPASARALDAAALASVVRAAGPAIPVEECAEIDAALARARAIGHALGAPVIACGSLFLVGEVRRHVLGEAADPVVIADPAARRTT